MDGRLDPIQIPTDQATTTAMLKVKLSKQKAELKRQKESDDFISEISAEAYEEGVRDDFSQSTNHSQVIC